MNPISHIFTSTYRVKWLKSKLTQTVKINIDENNLNLSTHPRNLGWCKWTRLKVGWQTCWWVVILPSNDAFLMRFKALPTVFYRENFVQVRPRSSSMNNIHSFIEYMEFSTCFRSTTVCCIGRVFENQSKSFRIP